MMTDKQIRGLIIKMRGCNCKVCCYMEGYIAGLKFVHRLVNKK